MKLRLKGDSIRLRLGRSEVSSLIESGIVEESTHFDVFGRDRLVYALISDPAISRVTATFESGRIRVLVPSDRVREWGQSDDLGIEATQPAPGGRVLKILIEKDLECLDAPPEESQADAFPRVGHGIACA
jgi:hypothetical protein